ncbi:MAG: hypothetical protein M1837_001157 [Sclerophora amabilis]|nr:MAG: hypothetical protein M1837_001157 [Sclerophora amabilis]
MTVRSYEDDSTSAVPRAEFNGYRDEKEAENRDLRFLCLEAFNEACHAREERDRAQQALHFTQAEQQRTLQCISRRRKTSVNAWGSFVRGSPGSLAEPYPRRQSSVKVKSGLPLLRRRMSRRRSDAPSTSISTAPTSLESTFLHDSMSEQLLEMLIGLLLLRVRIALTKKEFRHAESVAMEAVRAADRLEFRPLVGRCWFWVAVARYRREDFSNAAEAFGLASGLLDGVRAYEEEEKNVEWNAELTSRKLRVGGTRGNDNDLWACKRRGGDAGYGGSSIEHAKGTLVMQKRKGQPLRERLNQ